MIKLFFPIKIGLLKFSLLLPVHPSLGQKKLLYRRVTRLSRAEALHSTTGSGPLICLFPAATEIFKLPDRIRCLGWVKPIFNLWLLSIYFIPFCPLVEIFISWNGGTQTLQLYRRDYFKLQHHKASSLWCGWAPSLCIPGLMVIHARNSDKSSFCQCPAGLQCPVQNPTGAAKKVSLCSWYASASCKGAMQPWPAAKHFSQKLAMQWGWKPISGEKCTLVPAWAGPQLGLEHLVGDSSPSMQLMDDQYQKAIINCTE